LPSACKDEPKSYLGTGPAAQLTGFLVARGRTAKEGAARVATVACQVGVHQLNLEQLNYKLTVLRIRDVYPGSRIRLFFIPDPNFFHP
jgi:hypothetical protein